ncbi:hypothetical protein FJV46_08485 [Arthrobacter agilis]|uniref:hypothetical protein n=1 Tax=Arthrobacter agilis TaxID=37921 RepID=UPI000B35392D|nr:hypothetical protein [Arthrobacter agilis]OUM43163.1 hypothetical protein B8W74_08010 [Arthrobacter agilis]PPB46107.1 hypothetical protein CI784_10210 [Arthrobacter agilis]TPV25649.1 hypothetical protein FJV46_08485 [Arthrobacter agilis]WDF33043.1 hypothetical protein PTW37_14505 [Arthrobacter agilis]VDR33425.1 Uncharacterised protein [Arthrobacter agilis]
MTATALPTTARILDLTTVGTGTVVEARRKNEVHYRGCVEDAAPGLGVVWIRDDMAGHRAILHLDEYSIWQVGA